jgi:hypothetical protein
VEPRTAFSDERTERYHHLLAAESAGAADSDREEDLDHDYDNDHDRDDYDEDDRNADRCRRGLT